MFSTGKDAFELTRRWAEIPSTTGNEIEILRLVETDLEADSAIRKLDQLRLVVLLLGVVVPDLEATTMRT